MAENIKEQLLDSYSGEDMVAAQNYIRRRESAAHGLEHLIDALLKDAAERIIRICYQYNVDPASFRISAQYNKAMYNQISEVIEQLEEDIFDLLLDYATRCTESEKRIKALWPWIIALGRGNSNLRQTLRARLREFVKDIEAMTAALRMAKVDVVSAVAKARRSLHRVYTMPEVKAAFSKATAMQADRLRTKGVKHGNVGNSNSEANNIIRFAQITLQMTWMRNQLLNYKERGAEGYVVVRGSNYHCDICESHVGWHPIEDIDSYPQYHGHCMCIAIPTYNHPSPT